MKREHITLPTLQVAAAAFFFTSAQAKVTCVDETSTLVAASNCDGTQAANTFFLVPGRDSEIKIDAADPVARKEAGFPETGLVAGGFGRRQEAKPEEEQPPAPEVPDVQKPKIFDFPFDLGRGRGRGRGG